MSWTDLFKSKTMRIKPDPRLRWFGKLPTYADYYRSDTDESWAVAFNDWILRGFQHHQERRAAEGAGTVRGARLPQAFGVFRLPEVGMTVLASFIDFGGDMRGRPFPLCFYVGVPTHLWPGPTAERADAATQVLRDLVALGREVGRFLRSPGSFDSVFRSRTIELDAVREDACGSDWARAARHLAWSDWFGAAGPPSKITEANVFLSAVSAWGRRLKAHDGPAFEPTLTFPVSPSFELDCQWVGWLRWLEARLDVSQRALSFVVTTDGNAGGVATFSVAARDLVTDDFLLVAGRSRELSYVDHVSAAPTDATNTDPEVPVTWLDFVSGAA